MLLCATYVSYVSIFTSLVLLVFPTQVSQMLDDHIVMTQSMSFSPYKKPFEERIMKWEAQLSLVGGVCLGGRGMEVLVPW